MEKQSIQVTSMCFFSGKFSHLLVQLRKFNRGKNAEERKWHKSQYFVMHKRDPRVFFASFKFEDVLL